MKRKTKKERMYLVEQEALKIGLPKQHSGVLAKISYRRNLDGRIKYLLTHFKAYQDLMEKNKEMLNDPHSFYLKNKTFKYQGGEKFLRFGTLSHEYTQASSYNLVNMLIKDALSARETAKYLKIVDGYPPKCGEEYGMDFFHKHRFSELEKAFQQDIKSNKIPNDLVETIFSSLEFDKKPIFDTWGLGQPSKYTIMDSFYVFFSSEEGGQFVNEWKEETARERLVKNFSYRFFNDPTVNPNLIDRKKEHVDKNDYKDAVTRFKDSEVFSADGTPIKRSTIDASQDIIM